MDKKEVLEKLRFDVKNYKFSELLKVKPSDIKYDACQFEINRRLALLEGK